MVAITTIGRERLVVGVVPSADERVGPVVQSVRVVGGVDPGGQILAKSSQVSRCVR